MDPRLACSGPMSTFSYDSNDTNVVSFSGDVATALAVGKVRITATQAGNSNWLSANAYQDWIVTATPRSDQNITFAAIPNKNPGAGRGMHM